MKRKDLYMGSTEIDSQRTLGEITSYLVRIGANQIATSYDEKTREPIGLFFTLTVKGQTIPFQLPARVEPIFIILNAGRGLGYRVKDMEQAKRVAWRQIYRWIQAQAALIETGMVEAEEVFYPYIQVGVNETLYQRAVTGGFQHLQLAARAGE